MKNKLDHPEYYNKGEYEVVDVIYDWDLNFSLGNVVKYVARHKHKDDPLEDLKKARWYLEYEIQKFEDRKKGLENGKKLQNTLNVFNNKDFRIERG